MVPRALFAVGAALLVWACGPSAPRPEAPLANMVGAKPAGPCDLGWLEHAEELAVTESSNGHFGVLELRAALRARGDVFAGAVKVEYKRHHAGDPVSVTVELRLPRATVAGILAGLARGSRAPVDPPSPRGHLTSVDTSQSMKISVEASAWLRGIEHRARLDLPSGQVDPQPWSVHGCGSELTRPARILMGKEYRRLERLIRRDELLRTLEGRAP